jgi:hypothetical protein
MIVFLENVSTEAIKSLWKKVSGDVDDTIEGNNEIVENPKTQAKKQDVEKENDNDEKRKQDSTDDKSKSNENDNDPTSKIPQLVQDELVEKLIESLGERVQYEECSAYDRSGVNDVNSIF